MNDQKGEMTAGHDYIGVGVGVMVFNDRSEVLMAKRGAAARNERSFWEFPGGTVEFGERLTDTLDREFREEYGVEIRILETLGVFEHILPDEQHWIAVTFIARHVSGHPQILQPARCDEIGWYQLASLPQPLSKSQKITTEVTLLLMG